MNCLESRSRSSTEDNSSVESEDMWYPKTNPAKHKTELCKTFSELGHCPYGRKCRFAHGKEELVCRVSRPRVPTARCKGFWQQGTCNYGIRCQFGHAGSKWEHSAALSGLNACMGQSSGPSKLLRML